MHTGTCLLCLSVERRTIDIVHTPLLPVYEKITDFKIQSDAHSLCFICYARLRQSYQLWRLAKQTQDLLRSFQNNKIEKQIETHASLVQLTICRVADIAVSPTGVVGHGEIAEFKKEPSDDLGAENTRQTREYRDKCTSTADDEIPFEDAEDSQHERGKNDNEKIEKRTHVVHNFRDLSVKICKMDITAYHRINRVRIDSKVTEDLARNKLFKDSDHNKSSDNVEESALNKSITIVQENVCNKNSNIVEKRACSKSEMVEEKDYNKSSETAEESRVNIEEASQYEINEIVEESSQNTSSKFSEENALRTSVTVGASETFACKYCPFVSKQRTSLGIHEKVHVGSRQYNCAVCGRCFPHKHNYMRHMRTHTGDKPYVCEVCNNRFAQLSTLNAHKQVHTGEKPFSCDICELKFVRFSVLQRHHRVHTGDKPFRCQVCDRRYARKSGLIEHQRTHVGDKPYSCELCSRNFYRKTELNQHMRTHTGLKPYACEACERRFAHKTSLNKHRETHAAPWRNGFNNKGALLRHKKPHADDKPLL